MKVFLVVMGSAGNVRLGYVLASGLTAARQIAMDLSKADKIEVFEIPNLLITWWDNADARPFRS